MQPTNFFKIVLRIQFQLRPKSQLQMFYKLGFRIFFKIAAQIPVYLWTHQNPWLRGVLNPAHVKIEPNSRPGSRSCWRLEHPVLRGHGRRHVAGEQAAPGVLRRVRLRGVELGPLLEAGIVHRLQR